MVLNSAYPNSDRAQAIRADISSRYDVTCVCANCLELEEADGQHHQGVLYEFPVKELDLFLPPGWTRCPYDHPIKSGLYTAIRRGPRGCAASGTWSRRCPPSARARAAPAPGLPPSAWAPVWPPLRWSCRAAFFYDTLSQQSGFTIQDDGDLMGLLTELAQVKGGV